MHKAKGLQFPWVYVPFASNFKKEKKESMRSDAERLAEDKRLLYVALTRAERALFLGVVDRSQDFTAKSKTPASALSDLLGRTGADDLQAKLQGWADCPAIQVVSAPEPNDALYLPNVVPPLPQAALTPMRQHRNAGWMASFSALTRQLDHAASWTLPSENDERWADAQHDAQHDAQQDPQADSNAPLDGAATALAVTAPLLPFNDFKAGSAMALCCTTCWSGNCMKAGPSPAKRRKTRLQKRVSAGCNCSTAKPPRWPWTKRNAPCCCNGYDTLHKPLCLWLRL
jgi:ATP-dependent exoDNAse (exonuclease V) beta subunit